MSRLADPAAIVVALLRQMECGEPAPSADLGGVDWAAALAFANEELVAPELHEAIERAGRGDELPGDVRDYLAWLHDCNRARNEQIRRQLIEIAGAWNAAGICPVLLKGGIDLLMRPEASAARMTIDLDLLLEPGQLDQAIEFARGLGYERAIDYAPGLHTPTSLMRPGEPASVDLHLALLLPVHLLPAEAVRRDAIRLERDGVTVLAPSAEDRLMHLVLHDMVHHKRHLDGILSLRTTLDFARIVRACPELDWIAIRSRLGHHGAVDVLQAQRYAAQMLLGVDVPALPPAGLGAWLFYRRGIARWRRAPADEGWRPMEAVMRAMAYRFDPAAKAVPVSTKLMRRLLQRSGRPAEIG
jgi:Uncharacterised nucleotidyltransferase